MTSFPGGTIDLQINGYGGVDFNADQLSAEDLHRACERLTNDGVDGILATIITDDLDRMCRRIQRIASLCDADQNLRRIIRGIHVEGPFISDRDGFRGAHDRKFIVDAQTDEAARLMDAAQGYLRILTLAPERDPQGKTIRHLTQHGVCVSAGHTDASLDQLRLAIDQGLQMFTHLGNGCPLNQHRHDNIIQRVLSLASSLMIGFITDGVHVPMFALKNYFRAAGLDRCFVVTDAISAAGLGPGQYKLGRQTVKVDDNLATWSSDGSHLMGSAITMPQSCHRLATDLQLSESEILQLARINPMRFVGIDLKTG